MPNSRRIESPVPSSRLHVLGCRKGWRSLLCATLLGCLLPLAGAGSRAAAPETRDGRISSDLALAMLRAEPDETVDFVAVFSAQVDAEWLRIETEQRAGLEGWAAARAWACSELKAHSENSQGPLLTFLEQQSQVGSATRIRSLWIANAVLGRATPEVIDQLAGFAGIDHVSWNPPTNVDAQVDEIVPAGGRREIPARTTGAAGAAGATGETGAAGATGATGLAGFGSGERPETGWHLEQVNAPEVWAAGFDGSGVVVSVIDTGVDYTHPDLAARIWINTDEIPWNLIDDDFNGFVDDTLGWNFVMDNNDPMGAGTTDHGTRVAGIVAGDGASGLRTGVAPGATIMALRASGGDWGNVFEAIQYACDNGADVITMSLTQKWSFEPKPDYGLWRTITDNELALGMLHANSIGNVGDEQGINPIPFNIGVPGSCPAAWVHPDQRLAGGVSAVIGAGSVDSTWVLSDFSSRGPFAWEEIASVWPVYPHPMPEAYRDYPYSNGAGGLLKPDLLAPGVEVFSTRLGGGYMSFTGTSAACPHLGGALAVIRQARPDITPAQAAMVLQLAGVDLGPTGKENDYGAGMLDLAAALNLALTLDVTASISGTVTDAATGDSLSFARVTVLEAQRADSTDLAGGYAIYRLRPGLSAVEARAFGYRPDTVFVSSMPHQPNSAHFALVPLPRGELAGVVRDRESGAPVAGARVTALGTPWPTVRTGADGAFLFAAAPADSALVLRTVHFGHHWSDTTVAAVESTQTVVEISLAYGVFDDFELDQGWVVGRPGDTATDGHWLRCDPVGIWDGSLAVQPEDDATADPGRLCFVTGNGVPGAGDNQNDVDGGGTTLTSPCFDATWYWQPIVSFAYWYSNDSAYFVDDTLRVELSNDAGRSWVPLFVTTAARHAWTTFAAPLEEAIALTDSMCLRIIAADRGRDSSVEAAVDEFRIEGVPFAGADDTLPIADLRFHGARPSPLVPGGVLCFRLPAPARLKLEIYDVAGRRVRALGEGVWGPGDHRLSWDGADENGRPCPRGVYLARLETGKTGLTRKLVFVR